MRPIDADVLDKKLDDLNILLQKRAATEDAGFLAIQVGVTLAEGELGATPTLDIPAPVVHANWILHSEIPFGEPDKECSRCHAMSPIWSHYCHACGAKMDSKEATCDT